MMVLFDLQEKLENVPVGRLEGMQYLQPIASPLQHLPKLSVEEHEEVKFISVSGRTKNEQGISISLGSIPDLRPGDRITITGRVARGAPNTSWSLALFSSIGEANQLTQHISPKSLYTLTHVLEDMELESRFTLRTMQWGESNPTMDILVDSILITRAKEVSTFVEDRRDIVYSLSTDDYIQWVGMGEGNVFESSRFLQRSGRPTLTIFRNGASNAIHIINRSKDYDGLDILLERMNFIKGNEYQIQVTGRIDGEVPEYAQIMFQSVPYFSIRDNQPITSNQSFTLNCVLRRSALEKWVMLRITTNLPGAKVSLYIDSIEIRKVASVYEF
jgi:hypothetical protein